jgi:hypothetical protein
MRKRSVGFLAAICLCLVAVSTSSAAFTAFEVPPPAGAYTAPGLAAVTAWRTSSTLIPFPAGTFSSWSGPVPGLSMGPDLTITSSVSLVRFGPVPSGWASWAPTPLSENPTPFVAYTQGATSATLTFDEPVGGFSLEVEPNPFMQLSYSVTFAGGGMISAVIDGLAGSRMFGGTVDPGDAGITGVTISGPADFAFASVRARALTTPTGMIPEPSSLALLGIGVAGALGYGIRRRMKA